MEERDQNKYSILLLALIAVVISLVIYIERDKRINKVAETLTSESKSGAVEMEMETKMETKSPKESVRSVELTTFDPNTVELRQLLNMGLTKEQALSLLRYRASGKVFNIKEELISCYGFSDSLYFALEPYIVIGEEFQYKRRSSYQAKEYSMERKRPTPLAPTTFLIDTVGIKYLKAIGALSQRQGEVFVKWRDMSGIHSLEELKECYVISDSIAMALARYAIFTARTDDKETRERDERGEKEQPQPVDLNKADSATLRSVYGIGAKSVDAIVKYRTELGGFYSKEQLLEINVITDSNYEKIITQISVDSCDISKIDINFALAKTLSRHPYLVQHLRRLLHKRQMKGGWSTVEEMINDKIFTKEEAQRVRPYLHFEVQSSLK